MDDQLQIRLEELDNGALERAHDELESELASQGSRLASLHWVAVRDHAAEALNREIGKVDWLGCVGKVWCTATKLRELAAKTKAAPGTEEPLPLAEHSLSTDLHPVVTIRIGPVALPPLRFTLRLDAAIESAILVIADGKLIALEGAVMTPSANLYYGEQHLKELAKQKLPITGRYSFANGGIEIRGD